jgi:hypothetical protein
MASPSKGKFNSEMWLKVWLWLFFKVFFYLEMYQNNIFLFFFKLYLISAHQNDLKTPKKY